MPIQTLVIGYGNTLRRDDGVGYRAAEAVMDWQIPGVEAWPCHQLTPDLAALLADCDRAIFVDAALPQNPHHPLVLARLSPQNSAVRFTGHHSHPADLLTLAQQLYGQGPMAHALLLPSWDMGYGEELSPIAQTGLRQGLRLIQNMIARTMA